MRVWGEWGERLYCRVECHCTSSLRGHWKELTVSLRDNRPPLHTVMPHRDVSLDDLYQAHHFAFSMFIIFQFIPCFLEHLRLELWGALRVNSLVLWHSQWNSHGNDVLLFFNITYKNNSSIKAVKNVSIYPCKNRNRKTFPWTPVLHVSEWTRTLSSARAGLKTVFY